MAERLGDVGVRLIALYSRHWSVLGPDRLDEQLEAAAEIVRLARRSRHRDMEFHGHHFRLNTLLQLGDIDGVDAEIRACNRLAKELRQPLYLWQATALRAMRALLAGRFDEGERLAEEARQIGERSGQEIVTVVYGSQLFIARWGQGRLEEIEEAGAVFAERYPSSAWPAGLACLQVELGRYDGARVTLEHHAPTGVPAVRRDANWLGGVFFLADAITLLGDERRAAVLYDLMTPYADLFPTIVAGALALPSNELVIGMLAGLLKRWDDAAARFERALERIKARGMLCWLPGCQREYARMLLAQGAPGGRERALLLITEALDTAREQGMRRLVEQLLELKLEAQGISTVDAWTSIDAVAESVHALHPDLRPAAALDGTVTLMFSDIQDSTVMTEQLGDKQWMEVLRAHNTLVRRHLKHHGGFEVRSLGDGFMMAFPSARRALRCAAAIQRALAAQGDHGAGVELKVRMGLHTGETIRDEDDFFGRAVVLAARIAAAARGGEVLVSSLLHELIASTGEFAFDDGRELELKGLSGTHRVYALEWAEAGEGAPAATALPAGR
jgi:class 3 adenylate cyclase